MKRSSFGLSLFLILLSLGLFFLGKTGVINTPTGFLQEIFIPIQKTVYAISYSMQHAMGTVLTTFQKEKTIEKLSSENARLLSQVADIEKLKIENEALREQIGAPSPKGSANLIEAHVLGRGEVLILDKGTNHGVSLADFAVTQNILIGKVTQVSPNISQVSFITSPQTQIRARTLKTGASGVLKGNSGSMLFDNVTLEETLELEDVVVSSGDIDGQQGGFPPNLIIGKIVSVDKNESSLFQRAKVESPASMSALQIVFLLSLKK